MRKSLILAGMAMLATAPLAAQDIDTHPGTNFGPSPVGYHPSGQNWSVGQVFTVGATETVLDNFSFWVNDYSDIVGGLNPEDVQFRAYLAAYNPGIGMITSAHLYTSGPAGPAGSGTYAEHNFATGGISLAPGGTYIAFLSMGSFADPNPGSDTVNGVQRLIGSAYTGGFAAVHLTSGVPGMSSAPWTQQGVLDLAFTADFSAEEPVSTVPEPMTMVLLGSGLAGIGIARRRRRQSKSID